MNDASSVLLSCCPQDARADGILVQRVMGNTKNSQPNFRAIYLWKTKEFTFDTTRYHTLFLDCDVVRSEDWFLQRSVRFCAFLRRLPCFCAFASAS